MKIKIAIGIVAMCMTVTIFSGCGGEKREVFTQAEKDLEQGSYEYALQGYEASLKNEFKLPQSYRGAGIACMRLGEYQKAIEYFDSALNHDKTGKALEKDILLYKATAELKIGKIQEAIQDCQLLEASYPMDANSYFISGKAVLEQDRYEEARAYFDKAYEAEPTYEMAIEIYQSYLEKGMEADGTAYLEAVLEAEPENAEDHYNRGRVYYYMEDYKSAQEELIISSNQENTDAMLLLGTVYLAQNDISNARAMYQQYVSAVSDGAQGYNGLALCDIREESYEAALNNIEQGISVATADTMQSLLFNEIVIYEKQMDFATAQVKAEEYLEMYPEDTSIEEELVFLKSRTGK